VAEIASQYNDVDAFVDELAQTFIGIASSDVMQMQQQANTSTGEYYNSEGFRNEFYDSINDNQARHFTAGLIAGFKAQSVTAARLVMNHNENSDADRRLNEISMPPRAKSHKSAQRRACGQGGDKGGWRRISADPGFKGLADKIRKQGSAVVGFFVHWACLISIAALTFPAFKRHNSSG
jgi:hypothetical protein